MFKQLNGEVRHQLVQAMKQMAAEMHNNEPEATLCNELERGVPETGGRRQHAHARDRPDRKSPN
jgi:hypothetical protein